jgi:hypothetical protein
LLGFFPDLLSGSQLFFCNHPASAAIARALFNAIKVHPRASEHGHAPVGSGTATPKNRRATEIVALHAVLVESLTNTRALLQRLELGVQVAPVEQREVVRSLYVATRNQVRALFAVLELEGLE